MTALSLNHVILLPAEMLLDQAVQARSRRGRKGDRKVSSKLNEQECFALMYT